MLRNLKPPTRQQALGGLAILAGILGTIAIYVAPWLPLGFYALLIPVALAALTWGWWGGGIATVLALFVTLPVGLRDTAYLSDALFAFVLMVGETLLVAWLSATRDQHPTLSLPDVLPLIDQHLSNASDIRSVWESAIQDLGDFLAADAGAWVWDAPKAEVVVALGAEEAAYPPSFWRELIDCAGQPDHLCLLRAKDLPSDCAAEEVMLVPVHIDAWAGWLVLLRAPKSFTAAEGDLACAVIGIASQVVMGLLRYERVDQAREHRVQELETLHQVGRWIQESLDLDATLHAVLEALWQLVPYDAGEITLLDTYENVLVRRAVFQEGEVGQQPERVTTVYRMDEGLSGWLAREKSALLIKDVREFERIKPKSKALEQQFYAYLGIPLLARGELVGTLEVAAAMPGQFDDHDLELADLFGRQAAIAIEKARLYTQTDVELQRRLVALESLQRVTREITATVDLNYILQVVLREALAFSEAEAGLIALVRPNMQVEFRVQDGYDEEAQVHLQALAANGNANSVLMDFIKDPKTVYLADVLEQPSGNGRKAYPQDARSLLLTPVFYQERLAAAIMIQSSSPHAFTSTIVEYIEGLSSQTSIAVGNANLYQEQVARGELMHQRAEQMSLMLEVSRTMRSDRPLEDVLLDVAYAVQEGTGFDIVLISVLEGEHLRRVAGAGIPLADLERMRKSRQPWSRVKTLFQNQFRMGHCYYVPAEYQHLANDLDVVVIESENEVTREANGWNKLDMFLVPLQGSRDDVVGMMALDQPQSGLAPTPALAEVVEVFAGQVALAIENNRLVEDLRRQVNTLRLFNELNRSITTKLDLPVVLNTVAQSVTNLLSYDFATIFIRDRGGRDFIPSASSGYALELLDDTRFSLGEGLVGQVAETAMPLVLDDTMSDPKFVPGPIPVGSSVMVPLTVEGRSVGVITADRKVKGDFTPTDVATLMALADQVSVAVENARLFEEVTHFSHELEQRVEERTQELAEALKSLRVERDRTEVLYRIASELVASLDFDRVLSQALVLLQRAVMATRGAVILLDNNTGHLVYRAVIGHTEPIPPGGRVSPFSRDKGVVGWVLSKREAVVIPDVQQDERWIFEKDGHNVRSAMAVPIVSGTGEGMGVIFLQSPIVNAFDDSSLRLVEAAAIQLGNALNNSELYRLIREQAERLGVMLRTQQIEAAKNQAILEGIADGVMVADANGRVILFNAAAERILSIGRSQALGRFVDDILGLYGTEAREWLARIEQWKQSVDSYGPDKFLEHRLEADRRMVSVHLSPVVSPANEFIGVVSVFRDITAEVEADRAKSEFVSTVSHELRTPMTSIKGYVDLLLMGTTGDLSSLQRSFLATVKSNADRLTDLVNDLLDLSRIETGRIELHLEPLEIGVLIDRVIEMLQPKAKEKELNLYSVVPPNLPQIFGDEQRVTQILTNLVGNAYKYTPAGGEVSVHGYVRNGMMHIAVQDTGIGIGPENQKKIFDRFYRVDDPAVMEVSGTGLGLSITVSFIQMHGGEIWLESELGEGSIFTFTLPLAEDEPTTEVGDVPLGLSQGPMMTVMVVDDDREILNFLKLTLESEGFRVLRASSGEAALRLARRELPDLISLDVRLPDLDGFEVLQLLKRDPETADIPIVMVSVVADRERGLSLGAADYLSKPLDETKFLQVISRVLTRRGIVLVVDRDRGTLSRFRKELRSRGINVRTTTRGERVFRLASEFLPELIVINLDLPDVDGYHVLERLQRNPRTTDIPVIVMGAPSTEDERDHVLDLEMLGITRSVTIPFSIEALVEEIAEELSVHSLT